VKKPKKVESAITENGREWQRTFDAIAGLVFIQDKDFKIIKANKVFCDALKLKPEQVIGKKCYKVLHKSDKPWPECPFEKTLKDKNPHIEEVDDPGIGIPLLVSTSPIFDEKGEVVSSVHIAIDITERKKEEEEMANKVAELERFQKLTVDRELKMKELKAKICELEERAKEK